MAMSKELIAVGKVLKPHGVLGEIKVLILTDFPERFQETEEVYLVSPEGKSQSYPVEGVRFHGGCLLLTLEGIDTPEEVKAHGGWLVSVPEDELVELEEDEYWHFQLEGMQVLEEGGQVLGTLNEVITTPAHDIYAITTPQGREILIPAVAQFVLNVDLDKRTMTVRQPEIS